MAFPDGWGRKHPIVIDSDYVAGSGTHLNFPFLVRLNHLDTEVVDAGSNSALNGGGDLRFSSDEAGTTQLSVDIQEFITNATEGTRRCAVWVKVPSISGTSDTTIWVWYKKAAETQPAADAAYGSESVWSDYERVSHDGGVTEVTGNGNFTATGSPSAVTGPFGTTNGGRNTSSSAYYSATLGTDLIYPFTIQSYGQTSNVAYEVFYIGVADGAVTNHRHELGSYFTGSQGVKGSSYAGGAAQNATSSSEATVDTWRLYHYVCTGATDRKAYVQGSSNVGTNSTNMTPTNIDTVRLGATADSTPYGQPCLIAEARVRRSALSADWIETEHQNYNNPATFAAAGTPETPGGGSSTIPVFTQHYRNQGIM